MLVRRNDSGSRAAVQWGRNVFLVFRKGYAFAVTFLAIGVALFLGACTSLHRIDMSEDELHEGIRVGEILREGDRVEIVTSDKKWHEIWVTDVDGTLVHGERAVWSEDQVHGERKLEREKVSIPIDDIVGIKTREFSVGKTAVLSVGLYYLMMAIAAAAVVGNL